MLKGKTLLDYTNLFSPNDLKKMIKLLLLLLLLLLFYIKIKL